MKRGKAMKRKVGLFIAIFALMIVLLPVNSFAKENANEQLKDLTRNYFSMPIRTQTLNPVIQKDMINALTVPGKNSKYRFLSSSVETVYEQEPNDNPNLGEYDNFPLGYGMIGTMSNLDLDYHKIVITKPGTLVLGGEAVDYHKLGFLLLDNNLNVVTTSDDLYSDPTTNRVIEIMPNLPVGTYYVAVVDVTDPQDSFEYGYIMYAAMKPTTPIVNTVRVNDNKVTGKADPGDTISVQDAVNQTTTTGTVDNYGNFSVPIGKQKNGAPLIVQAQDPVSSFNSDPITVTVAPAIDKTPPSKLTVNTIHKTTTYVTGKTEAAASIKIKVGSKTIGTGKADSKGNFKVKIKAQKLHTKITISAIDAAGNAKTIMVTIK
jgi:hypothetical protein